MLSVILLVIVATIVGVHEEPIDTPISSNK